MASMCSRCWSKNLPPLPRRIFEGACATLNVFVACLLLLSPAFANDKKLTEDDRIEILRGMMAEFATVKSSLPRSPKPLPFESTGSWDKQKWAEAAQKFGPAARVGKQSAMASSTAISMA